MVGPEQTREAARLHLPGERKLGGVASAAVRLDEYTHLHGSWPSPQGSPDSAVETAEVVDRPHLRHPGAARRVALAEPAAGSRPLWFGHQQLVQLGADPGDILKLLGPAERARPRD